MKIAIGMLASAVFGISLAQAQIMVAQPQQAQTVQQAQTAEVVQVAEPAESAKPAETSASPSPPIMAMEVDEQTAALHKLQNENKKLREENSRLQTENTTLTNRVGEFTGVGGSEVRAYCPTATTSRNTAGAEANCRDLGGYTCENVSGLCRTSCQTTDMCAPGWTCDTGAQQCVNTSGG